MTNADPQLNQLAQQFSRFERSLERIETLLTDGLTGTLDSVDTSFDKSVFLSYRRSDSAYITGRIYDRMAETLGPGNIFRDVDDILLGRDFTEQLQQQLEVCDLMLVVIGPTWVSVRDAQTGEPRLDNPNDVVRQEVQISLRREIPVIPLLVRGAEMPREEDLPFRLKPLADKAATTIRPDPNFHSDVDELIVRIRQTLNS